MPTLSRGGCRIHELTGSGPSLRCPASDGAKGSGEWDQLLGWSIHALQISLGWCSREKCNSFHF